MVVHIHGPILFLVEMENYNVWIACAYQCEMTLTVRSGGSHSVVHSE